MKHIISRIEEDGAYIYKLTNRNTKKPMVKIKIYKDRLDADTDIFDFIGFFDLITEDIINDVDTMKRG